MHLTEYLFCRIHQLGIRSVFGCPGDFNLVSLDYLEPCGLNWVGNTNELNAGYAADGYSRIRGISALMTTLGVGELSAINALAGSNAELVPVIHIVGYPSTAVQEKGLPIHHTLGDGDFERFARMSAEISSAVVVLKDKFNAAKLIDETILECLRSSKPVYIGLPMDLVRVEVDPSPLAQPLAVEDPAPNLVVEEENAVNMILDRILAAQSPIIIVDSLAGKPHTLKSARSFVERSGLPCFITQMAKGIIHEDLPNFRGIWAERVSQPTILEEIQRCDLVLNIGPRSTDINTAGFKTDVAHTEAIKFESDRISLHFEEFPGLAASGVLFKLGDALYRDGRSSPSTSIPSRQSSDTSDVPRSVSSTSTVPPSINSDAIVEFQGNKVDRSALLTQDWVWKRISSWLEEDDIIAADIGTSSFGTLWSHHPRGAVLLTQLLWCSIGYAVGAAVGAALAAREDDQKPGGRKRRTILFTGDGSLQMTVQEFSTMVRRKLGITMFVVCNEGYTIERLINGAEAEYNDIQPWDYKLLPSTFQAAPESAHTYAVHTQAELDMLLLDPSFGPAEDFDDPPLRLVELHMAKHDAPESLRGLMDIMVHGK
ncbi:Thiamine pyrophosphate enzyme C-terminal TPP-binding [Penicillium brevicompactum]|uniref:Pyruvate decarboxylase n=1 Tax=Penicillium brevicompactum TaxID=5074 RepID=A0A9W9RMN9_PENBR|nr:Thiamine pyrophosphate enzyme C-terminal TPP-binding [Penicillium brevicompactum]